MAGTVGGTTWQALTASCERMRVYLPAGKYSPEHIAKLFYNFTVCKCHGSAPDVSLALKAMAKKKTVEYRIVRVD